MMKIQLPGQQNPCLTPTPTTTTARILRIAKGLSSQTEKLLANKCENYLPLKEANTYLMVRQ